MFNVRVLLSAIACAAVASLLGAGETANAADLLYASTGDANVNGGGRIYTIDPVAQTVSLIGNTGLNRLGGLAFDGNGVLYGANEGSFGPSSLYTIDPNSALATPIGPLSGIEGVDALAFDAGGTLYGGGWNGTEGRLLTIDPANGNILTDLQMTGSGNAFCAGLAVDLSDQLFGSRGNAGGRLEDLVEINVVTGQETAIGLKTDVISDIWFGPSGTLYGGSPTGDLFEIDPTTGVKSLLFNTGIRISGLTGIPAVPDSGGSVTLLAIAIFGVVAYGRRLAVCRA